MNATWLTVDFDDLRHVPSFVGHPTRSKHTFDEVAKAGLQETLSEQFVQGMHGFTSWLETNTYPVTPVSYTHLTLPTKA